MMNSWSSGCLLGPATGFAGSLMTMSLSVGINRGSVNLSNSGCYTWVLLNEVVVGAITLAGWGGSHILLLHTLQPHSTLYHLWYFLLAIW